MTLRFDATSLLLRLLEARELLYTRSTVMGRDGATAGAELIDRALLVPAGFTSFVVDDDGGDDPEPVEVHMDNERGQIGYHSRFRGWIKVERLELQRYRLDIGSVLRALLGDELRSPRQGVIEIEADLIWEVGQLRLVKTGLTTVWLVRRLSDRSVEDRLWAASARHPVVARRLILTSTPRVRIRDGLRLEGTALVPLEDVLSAYKSLSIDMERLQARFAERASVPVTGPLHLSDDWGVLTIMGTTIEFSGDAQRKAIRIMVNAYRASRGVNAAKTLEDAGFRSSIRTWRQAFRKQWPLLEPYLKSRNKLWYFEL